MAALTLVLALTAACGGDAAAPAPVKTPAPAEVTGLVTEVRLLNDEVVGFTVDAEGTTYEVLIDPEVDYGFDLRHLEEHRDMRDPVIVELDSRDGELYAVSIVDA